MDCVGDSSSQQSKSRDYICPCGKTYLSYAALFTHIKQKHNGKAPGDISRPKVEAKPRGRPPLNSKPKEIGGQKELEASRETSNLSGINEEKNDQTLYKDAYFRIFTLLKNIVRPQEIEAKVWEQVDSFKKLDQFIDQGGDRINSPTKLGYCLSQFLQGVSMQALPYEFQQVLLLFMLLLQYLVDETNNERVLEEGSGQLLVQFMNPFMNWHIEDFSEYLEVDHLWVMRRNNMQEIFLCFYNWLKWKKYTDFCITLID